MVRKKAKETPQAATPPPSPDASREFDLAQLGALYDRHLDDAMGHLHNRFVGFISEAKLPLTHVIMVLSVLLDEAKEQARKKVWGGVMAVTWKKLAYEADVEPALGNPAEDHCLLSSEEAGTRWWMSIDALRLLLELDPQFVTSWKTNNAGTSNSDQITLPLESTGTYDFWVNWGDGTALDHITAYNQAEVTHTFPAAGTYTVAIAGTIQGWRFNDGADKLKILSITSWGPLRLGNLGGYFYGCSNLTIPATDTLDMTGTTTLYLAFRGCAAITTFPSLATLDTSQVTDMTQMFYGCAAFNQSVANLDTAKVKYFDRTFYGCAAFNQSVANFNTAEATDMSQMFRGCNTFNQSVSSFNTAKVTDMYDMFYNCQAFNQSVANFDTAKVTTMVGMFYNCRAFNQDVSNFDTAKVTTMYYMFQSCIVFNQDVSGWDVQLVTTMADMFNGANALSTANYDALLIAWAALDVQDSVAFHAGDAKYTGGGAAEAGRTHLADAVPGGHAWTITDGGAA